MIKNSEKTELIGLLAVASTIRIAVNTMGGGSLIARGKAISISFAHTDRTALGPNAAFSPPC